MGYSKKSFSILGVLISVQILATAIVAIVGLMSSVVINSKTAGNRLIAVELAQEGIEIVRNIRDKNWLMEASDWRDGLADGIYQARINTATPASPALIALTAANKKIKLNASNWYVDGEAPVPGTETIFERVITISTGGSENMIIGCEVAWQERGRNFSINLEDWLYKWK